MKKLISIILILCCVLSLCACEAVEKMAEVELPPVPTADAAEEIPDAAGQPETAVTETEHQHIIINIDRTEYEAYDPQKGTELILSFSYETPYVHIPANPGAEEAINEFIALLNESYYTGDDYGTVYNSGLAPGYFNMLTQAEDNYNYIINSAINFEGDILGYELACHRTLSIERCDEAMLSLIYRDYVNLGGVHGSYGDRAYCFDTKSGELMGLEDICSDYESFCAFLKESMINKVNTDAELQQRINGFVDVEGLPTLEEAVTGLIRDGSWYLDNEGMVIFSDLYEMSSYAAGIIEFRFSYEELRDYIRAELVPENIQLSAAFAAVPVAQSSESSREIIDMVKIHEQGEGLYLVADGTAKDVRLTSVDYIDAFYETAQLWYCSSMENCAVQLVTLIPEGMPELKLSYRDSAGEHSLYLSQSGEDGSIILVDDSIEAVG